MIKRENWKPGPKSEKSSRPELRSNNCEIVLLADFFRGIG